MDGEKYYKMIVQTQVREKCQNQHRDTPGTIWVDLYCNNIRASDKVSKKVVKYVALKVLKLDASLCIFSEDAKCLVKGNFDFDFTIVKIILRHHKFNRS
jgi:hypothetical protein